ncbi:hypothetical protein FQA39_LY19356 [Lamprigera yunnana]|nr:hypothetical protein FQA39_LY19356 [Lamprigera yunnana]
MEERKTGQCGKCANGNVAALFVDQAGDAHGLQLTVLHGLGVALVHHQLQAGEQSHHVQRKSHEEGVAPAPAEEFLCRQVRQPDHHPHLADADHHRAGDAAHRVLRLEVPRGEPARRLRPGMAPLHGAGAGHLVGSTAEFVESPGRAHLDLHPQARPYAPLGRISAERPVPADVKPLEVEVVAMDWKWLFIYPEQGIATINELAAPVDRPIRFKLTSTTTMNAFYVPDLAGMIYAMPSMQTQLNGVINKVGVYKGMSSHYSGAGFAGMTFKFHG